MDNELFELCKEVYKRFPEWKMPNHQMNSFAIPNKGVDDWIPLYNSDYLLEKLPRQIMGKTLEIYGFDEETGMYLVRYDVMELVPSNQGWYGARADTPLKALLKLTIELHKQGLLI